MSRYTTENSVVFKPGYHRAINHPSNSRDGTANAAADLEEFIYDNPNAVVKVESRIPILLSNFGKQGILTGTESVKIDFGQTKINYLNTLPSIHLDNTGNASDEYSVTAISNVQINSGSHVTRLTLSVASGVQAHQWVAVYSSDVNPSKSGGRMGQIHQVIQDETADPYVYLCGKVGKIASFTTSIKMRILSSAEAVNIRGGIWQPLDDADDLGITTRSAAIKLLGHVDPRVKDVRFISPLAQCVWLQCSAAAIVDNYTVQDTLNNADSGGYSYGVILYGMNGNTTCRNGIVRNCRHPAGTTDGNNGSTSTWYIKGEPTNGTFFNTRGYNCYGSVLDSHEEGINMVYDGIVSHNCLQDERATFAGRAFQGRSFNETVRNVTVVGGTGGISFDDVDHGELDQVVIENISIRKINNGSGGGVGIDLKDNENTNKRHYKMKNVTLEDCDKAVNCGDKNILTYEGLTASRCDIYMDVHDGCIVTGTGTKGDFRDTPAASPGYMFIVRSEAASNPYIRLLDKPIVMKGGNSIPAALFHEQDTAGTKYVWHPGIIDFDGGYTAITSKSAGSTTFSNLTDVNQVAL